MKRSILFLITPVLILLFTYGSAFAISATYTGCLKPDGKIFRVKVGLLPTKPCKTKWLQITWDQGDQGDQGPEGPVGPIGPKGNKGDRGPRGTDGSIYTGDAPINVDNTAFTVGLNPGSAAGDLLTYDGANWVAAPPRLALDDKMQPWLGMNYIIALQGTFPSRTSSSPFLAEIIMFAGNFAPRGWAFCDGQILPINQNQALFSLLGTTYGGDGEVTFALPDLRGRVPVGPRPGPGLTTRNLGARGGSETHQ
jgi:microcystin-dependent protein